MSARVTRRAAACWPAGRLAGRIAGRAPGSPGEAGGRWLVPTPGASPFRCHCVPRPVAPFSDETAEAGDVVVPHRHVHVLRAPGAHASLSSPSPPPPARRGVCCGASSVCASRRRCRAGKDRISPVPGVDLLHLQPPASFLAGILWASCSTNLVGFSRRTVFCAVGMQHVHSAAASPITLHLSVPT